MGEINWIMKTYGAMVSLLIKIRVFMLVMTYSYLRLRRRRIHNRGKRCYSPRLKVTRQFCNVIEQGDFQTESRSECSTATSKSKKRKVYDENDDRFLEAMNMFFDKTESKIREMTSQMNEVAQGVGSKFDSAKKIETLYETLCGFDFLTLETRVLVSQYFANNPNVLDIFYSFPSDAKVVMRRNIMKKF